MSKYEPLNAFLKLQTREYLPMTFGDIERVLGNKLPPSKLHRAWWSNNPSNNVMTKEWLDAGYETESVDVPGEKLVFRKVRKSTIGNGGNGSSPRPRFPGIGFMKGLISFDRDFDSATPFSAESWDEGYLGEDRAK